MLTKIIDFFRGKPEGSASADEIVSALRGLHQMQYSLAVREGVANIIGGPFSWFSGGTRMWKIHQTPLYSRIMREGPGGLAYQTLIEARLEVNDISREEVVSQTERERKVLFTPSKGSDILRAAVVEMTSPYDVEPTHLKINGKIEELIVSEPGLYAQLAAERVGKMIGFLKNYGANDDGKCLSSMKDIYQSLDRLESGLMVEGMKREKIWEKWASILGVDFRRYK